MHINIGQIFRSVGGQSRPEINITNECVQLSASPLKGRFEPVDINAPIKTEDIDFIIDVNPNPGVNPIRLKFKPDVETVVVSLSSSDLPSQEKEKHIT